PEQLEGMRLVIAATSDSQLNREIAKEADRRNIWCNVVDQPEDCTFILPSIVVRGDLTIAISTSGKSPALARKIREELEGKFGKEYETLTELLGLVRKKVLERYKSEQERKKIFTSLVESNMVELIKGRKWEKINSLLVSLIGSDFSLDKLEFRKKPDTES
ncbi:MAG: bifunctional precorrin-2 dehydrogenase/sirohydrochlorin ferrochelatase, partial [Deltaproteobacteria bacterium]